MKRQAKKIVVDSSVLVKWANAQEENHLEQADKLAEDAKDGKVVLMAPELAKYEVGNVLWKKRMKLPMAKAALGTIYAGPVEFVRQNESEAMRAMEIAGVAGVSFYDASFGALAEKLKADLITDNVKHQGKFSEINVVNLKDY